MVRSRCLPVLALALLAAGCAAFRHSANRPPFKKLSPPIAYEIMRDSPDMLVLDLRTPGEYNGETGHLRGAQNIPLERLPYRMLEISAFRDETLLVYCRADDCGAKGMEILIASGFDNAILMEGGIDAWIREGFKTVLPAAAVAAPRPPADGRGPVAPRRPGEMEAAPRREVPVVPPPPPPPRLGPWVLGLEKP